VRFVASIPSVDRFSYRFPSAAFANDLIMIPLPPSGLDVDEFVTLDDSTAPTTPEGSLSFSPQLHPQDVSAYLNGGLPENGAHLSPGLLDGAGQSTPIRNICCVGAGFVGEPSPLSSPES
jgi:UDPglucose 6-dehydrogenase